MLENLLFGPLKGVGPEISTFLDPNVTRVARCHFRAQKSLDFRAEPLPMALVMDVAHYATPHINKKTKKS
jgi:hypothetical protein